MTTEIRKKPDGNFEVFRDGEFTAGPFISHAKAADWIESEKVSARTTWQDLPEDIRKKAKIVETTYLQRRGTDLASMIAVALAEERGRCHNLAKAAATTLIVKEGGLRSRMSFSDLAEQIRKGDTP